MKKNYTHITILLDRSGSMDNCWTETINSLKNFIKDQREFPGKTTFSFYYFDDVVECDAKFQSDVYINERIVPRNYTALYDAFKQVTDETGKHLASMAEKDRPEKVIFLTLTDGGENASKYANIIDVREILNRQKNVYSWEFTFLGANFDAKTMTESLGVNKSFAWNYSKGKEHETLTSYSASVRGFRAGGQSLKASLEANESKVS